MASKTKIGNSNIAKKMFGTKEILLEKVNGIVVYQKVSSGYAVSCSYYDNTTPNRYQFSIDNGLTWTDITATGLLGTFTQIKFRIVDDIGSGTGAILSTKLGMTLDLQNALFPGASVESSNYTLTEAIDDIRCYELTPSLGYTLTVNYGGTYFGGDDAVIWFKTNSAPTSNNDRTIGAHGSGLVDSDGFLISSPRIFSNVTKVYIWSSAGTNSYVEIGVQQYWLTAGYANATEITLSANTMIDTYAEIED